MILNADVESGPKGRVVEGEMGQWLPIKKKKKKKKNPLHRNSLFC